MFYVVSKMANYYRKISKFLAVGTVSGSGLLFLYHNFSNNEKNKVYAAQGHGIAMHKWDANWDRRNPAALLEEKGIEESDKNYKTELEKHIPKATRHVFLIRHGQFNIDGTSDKERYLTALGRKQAEYTGIRLKELNFPYTIVYKSTMTRAQETAEKWLVFAGDCPLINEILETKSEKSVFVIFHYINSLLRSFGQVLSTNNPISGLIIIIAIASANYKAMFAALLTSSLSFFFAKFLQQDILGNLNGFFGYNAVLHAVVSVSLLPTLYDAIFLDEPKFWLFLIMATLISVYFTSATANLLRYLSHHPIPCFTLPFNLLQYVLIFCLLNNAVPPKIISSHLLEPSLKPNDTGLEIGTAVRNETPIAEVTVNEFENLRRRRKFTELKDIRKEGMDDGQWLLLDFDHERKNYSQEEDEILMNKTHLNWGKTFSGTIVALSQVYGLNNTPCAILMYLALVIYSPTTALFSYCGSFLGTLVGVSFASDFEEVYNGEWGYNGLLCAGALAGFGFVLTPQSAFLALVAVLFCTAFQHFLMPLFLKLQVPIFHLPFIVTTIAFLLVTAEDEKTLPRPGILTYPEKHRQEFKEHCKQHMKGYLSRARVSETFSS